VRGSGRPSRVSRRGARRRSCPGRAVRPAADDLRSPAHCHRHRDPRAKASAAPGFVHTLDIDASAVRSSRESRHVDLEHDHMWIAARRVPARVPRNAGRPLTRSGPTTTDLDLVWCPRWRPAPRYPRRLPAPQPQDVPKILQLLRNRLPQGRWTAAPGRVADVASLRDRRVGTVRTCSASPTARARASSTSTAC
jgi:hypothetical protein